MTPAESQLIEAYRARLAEDHRKNYLDPRHGVDPNEPDCRPVTEIMIDQHPDPRLSRKGLCYECNLHEDSLRKYLGNRWGLPFGLVERLMRLTGCHKPLYWLARRCGYVLVHETSRAWDRRRRPPVLDDIERAWLDLKVDLASLRAAGPSTPGKSLTQKQRRALARIQELTELLQGLRLQVESIDPQMSLAIEED